MELSPSQQQAVDSPSQNILVLAGPGSGKTRVMCERIQRLLADGNDRQEIVAITFTNAAAKEIQERLDTDLGYCGTIHGFMLSLLRKHGDIIGMPATVAIADADQQNKILTRAARDTKWKGTKTDLMAVIEKGSPTGNGRRLSGAEVTAAAYYATMNDAGLVDYQGILIYGLKLIQSLRAGGAPWPYQFLFVDELQDSCDIFMEIFKALPMPNHFYVGDPDQSIYKFMGANLDHILTLADRPDCEVIKLEGNYRSGKSICSIAQRLIENNTRRIAKQTRPMRDSKGAVHFWTDTPSPISELHDIATAIQRDMDPYDTAILYRYNHPIAETVRTLEEMGLPVARKSSERKPEDWPRARALVNLLINPYNNVLAADYIELTEGIEAREEAERMHRTTYIGINEGILHFDADPSPEQLHEIMAREGIGFETVDMIKAHWAELPDNAGLLDLSFALGSELGHQRETGKGVTVTTIHSSKGREWANVFLPAFEQSTLPGNRKADDLEEDRRLAYVGITRAKDRLVVSSSLRRTPQFCRTVEDQKPSEFVWEMRGQDKP